jgi:RNA polymerase sigma-70 factor, ECF subfamily
MTASTENIWKEFNFELLRFIKKRVSDNEIARDLLQDIFIKIHLKISSLSEADKLTSWVYQITRNSIIDYYKKQKPTTQAIPEIVEQDEPETFNEEFGNCVKPFVNQLPEIYRDAILQTELGQLSQKEFAEKSGISYTGAKSRVQRGRQQLVEIFNQCCKISTDKYGNILEYNKLRQNCSDC